MKQLRNLTGLGMAILGMGAVVLAGCQTERPFAELPGVPAATNSPSKSGSSVPGSETFQRGDSVIITYSGPGVDVPPTHTETIKDDGTITPPTVGSVIATGKTPGQLQKELQQKYDVKYRNLTVTVVPKDRYFYVDGEVNRKGPCLYLGESDIVKAIAAAGGFTEFAKKTKVRLIHPNGKTEVINYKKAIIDPTYKFPVYPGDKIFVPRKWFFD